MEEFDGEPVFLRCMATLPRSTAMQLGKQFEKISQECHLRAIMVDENLFHMSGSLQDLVRFHDQVVASQGDENSKLEMRNPPTKRKLLLSDDSARESKSQETVERVPVDVNKLSTVLSAQPDLLQDCSQNGATVYFPALCVEGQPHQRAQAIDRLRERVSSCTDHAAAADTASSMLPASESILNHSSLEHDAKSVRLSATARPSTQSSAACVELASFERSHEASALTQTYGVPERHAVPTRMDAVATVDDDGMTLMRWCATDQFVIEVRFGDLVRERVDAIVNPANERLWHVGGVAAAIIRAGGERIIRESNDYVRRCGQLRVTDVVPTSGGQLPCRHVLHTVGPRWSPGSGEHELVELRTAVTNALHMAQQLRCRAVAMPAISSGIFGMPLAECASCLFTGVDRYLQQNRNTCVQTIHFTNNDEETCIAFCRELSRHYGSVSGVNGIDFVAPMVQEVLADGSDEHGGDMTALPQPPVASMRTSLDDSVPAPHTVHSDKASSVCPVCLDEVEDPVKLPKCSHVFCRQCWHSAKKVRPACPVCKTTYGKETGNQPLGSMTVNNTERSLPGYPDCGTIQITYVFAAGMQGPEHPNPGQIYQGTLRQAYLPDNAEGRQVLSLLQRAFDDRLTFTVGTSVTTGTDNVIVWNGIHHKTNVTGGPQNYGYPDLTYLNRVRAELADKGIM